MTLRAPEPQAIVVGASGDLAKMKIAPALYRHLRTRPPGVHQTWVSRTWRGDR
ncbi:MAG TPA: hypothetical protein VG993_05825 [Actinomycetota bacterium]|jgi:glucose-6-phosphate 1-dehydrogenase|nr:hypothetical protein [Actinomycetota bacterium]